VLHLAQAFMAPWAALLTVQATVFGTARSGIQQAGGSVLGVLISYAAWRLLGVDALSLGVAVVAGLALGSVRGVRAQSTTAATAVVVLTTGYVDKSGMLLTRLADTGVGITTGLLVNLIVWPPLRDRHAAAHIDAIDDRVGELLVEIAAQMRAGCTSDDIGGWIARTAELDDDVERGWRRLAEARESGRLNLRRQAPRRMDAAEGFASVLTRLAQALAEIRSMARTIRVAPVPPDRWDRRFSEAWLDLLHRTGDAVVEADTEEIKAVRAELTDFSNHLALDRLDEALWPIYGALLVNLRNILDELDAVADAQPVRVSAPPPAALRVPRPTR
jgi:uncharacterized membrane protein YgaE (UPF0421/DUF939 family)